MEPTQNSKDKGVRMYYWQEGSAPSKAKTGSFSNSNELSYLSLKLSRLVQIGQNRLSEQSRKNKAKQVKVRQKGT